MTLINSIKDYKVINYNENLITFIIFINEIKIYYNYYFYNF